MKLYFTIVFVIASVITMAQNEEKKPQVIPITEALTKGLFEFKMSGASDPRYFHEVVDRDGVHFGKCMSIIFKSKIDSLILIRLESGSELIPVDSTFQTMIVTKTVEFPLYPNQVYATRFYAMCGQLHDDPPYIESSYNFGEWADSNTIKLAKYLDLNFLQGMPAQHALWAYTDSADFEELEKYGADSLSISITKEILNGAKIYTNVNPQLPVLIPQEKDTIEVKKIFIYLFGILFLLFVVATIFLFLNSKFKRTKLS